MDDLFNTGKDKLNELNERRIKQKNETKIKLNITNGKKSISNSITNTVTLWQQRDGYIYFNSDDDVLYEFVDFTWHGPQYKTVTKSETIGKEKGKTKRKGRLIGGAIGALTAPITGPVGLAVGLIHGTGNKKSEKDIRTNTVTTDETIELETPASIKLKNKQTGEHVSIGFNCTIKLSTEISALTPVRSVLPENKIKEEPIINVNASIINNEDKINTVSKSNDVVDIFETLKKLKELLDMGILTQEEYNNKKKEILKK